MATSGFSLPGGGRPVPGKVRAFASELPQDDGGSSSAAWLQPDSPSGLSRWQQPDEGARRILTVVATSATAKEAFGGGCVFFSPLKRETVLNYSPHPAPARKA